MTFNVTVAMTMKSGQTISSRQEMEASSADVAIQVAIRSMRTQLRMGDPISIWTYAAKSTKP